MRIEGQLNEDEYLEGSLVLEGFTNVKSLNCRSNHLSSLVLKGFKNLEELDCSNNYLTDIEVDDACTEKLSSINLNLNKIRKQNLSLFSKFVNLEEL